MNKTDHGGGSSLRHHFPFLKTYKCAFSCHSPPALGINCMENLCASREQAVLYVGLCCSLCQFIHPFYLENKDGIQNVRLLLLKGEPWVSAEVSGLVVGLFSVLYYLHCQKQINEPIQAQQLPGCGFRYRGKQDIILPFQKLEL